MVGAGFAVALAALALDATPATSVRALLSLRTVTRAALAGKPSDERAYERLRHLSYFHDATHPAHFYFAGDKLVMVYIDAGPFLERLTPAIIRKELGHNGAPVRSRAGKAANQFVYAELGFAYSETGGVLDFVEIFPPTTLADYRARIYEDPGVFIK